MHHSYYRRKIMHLNKSKIFRTVRYIYQFLGFDKINDKILYNESTVNILRNKRFFICSHLSNFQFQNLFQDHLLLEILLLSSLLLTGSIWCQRLLKFESF